MQNYVELQEVMNINQDQRQELLNVVEQNGRAEEFYEKYGKARIVKNEKVAQVLLNQIVANDELSTKLDKKNREERETLEEKQDKAKKVITNAGKILEEKLTKLGYSQGNEYVGGIYQATLREDTSITRNEYEMFKKRARVAITCAPSLEEAQKAIDNYLNLVK